MPIIRAVVRNLSRYPIDAVWENAQDLEHVTILHPETNKSFTLLHAEKHKDSSNTYDVLVYRATRKVYFMTLGTFGFRRIVKKYQINQVEYLPILGVTTALNSLLVKTGDPAHPTLLLDEVLLDVPALLYPLRGRIIASLQRHAAIQCRQDEPFRQRRELLREKGIDLPFRLFNESVFSELTSRFQETLDSR